MSRKCSYSEGGLFFEREASSQKSGAADVDGATAEPEETTAAPQQARPIPSEVRGAKSVSFL